MKAKVERLRMGLVAATLLLLVVVAGTFGYSRYKAGKLWLDRAKKRSGVSIERETDGFTYSQSLQGETVFTLHAAKAFQHTDGLWTLHDVVITLYGVGGDKQGRADRIYGNEFEWDENKGIARAIGDVQMDLQVPSGIAVTERHTGTAQGGDAQSIHVRTSGMTFLRQLGVAATAEPIEIRYGGLICTARGGEFDSNPSSLHLLADVKANGEVQGKAMALTATHVDFDRASETLSLVQPIVSDQQGKARAAAVVLHLRADGSVETAEATGGFMMDEGTRQVSAPRLDAVMNEKNQPQTAKLSGGVRLVDDSTARPARGESGEVLLRFDALGQPSDVLATNGVDLSLRVAGNTGAMLERDMRAQQMEAALVAGPKGKAQLRQVHATGAATMRGDSMSSAALGVMHTTSAPAVLKTNSVAADDLLAKFVTQGTRARLDTLHGQGCTVLRQTSAFGEEHNSFGDTLDAVFAADTDSTAVGQIAIVSAVQQGHVSMMSRGAPKASSKGKPETVANGSADRANYDGATERLTLTGNAHLVDGDTSLSAGTVVVDQKTGDAEARGNVVGTLAGKDAQSTHIAASRALVHHATQIAEFEGGDGKLARLWQQASQVEAATITLDRQKKLLTARPGVVGGTVHSVFAGVGVSATKGAPEPARASKMPSILRVESSQMDYSDEQREATFAGPVRIDGATGDVLAQRANVFFAPPVKEVADTKRTDLAMPSGGLERVVVSGDVRVQQPGRQGTGEQLIYKSSDGSFVLTGTPKALPRVVDAQQGTVTGAALLFRAGDSTIVVTGAPAAAEENHPRARIETKVRQKTE